MNYLTELNMFSLIEKMKLRLERAKLEVDRDVESYRAERNAVKTDMARQCAEQLGEHEHNFHHKKELLGIELAKLEAKVEALKDNLDLQKKLAEQKDREIESLKWVIDALITKQNAVNIIKAHQA